MGSQWTSIMTKEKSVPTNRFGTDFVFLRQASPADMAKLASQFEKDFPLAKQVAWQFPQKIIKQQKESVDG